MRTVIRPQSFETNSSSEHALVWSKTYNLPAVAPIHYIRPRVFGWGYDAYTEPADKISYLWAGIGSMFYDNPIAIEAWKARMIEVLNLPDGVEFGFDTDYYGTRGLGTGIIDHSNEMYPLLEELENDDELLRSFVYGQGTIECGSDNDGWPDGHFMDSIDFAGGYDDETQEWVEPRYQWETLIDDGDNWIYLKGN